MIVTLVISVIISVLLLQFLSGNNYEGRGRAGFFLAVSLFSACIAAAKLSGV